MASLGLIWSCTLAFSFQLCFLIVSAKKTYIVQMKHQEKPTSFSTHHDWYTAHLQSELSSSFAEESILYSYTISYHGYAASLEPEEAELLRRSDSVLGVYEDTVYSLHTTRSPEFLGLTSEPGLWAGHSSHGLDQDAQNVIIGVLDTGVWPESKSFDDTGLSNIPSRWRGKCVSASDFNPKIHCNKKLIGAQYFLKGYRMAVGEKTVEELESPRDQDGHGTHTSSTAAGSFVASASLFGYASGTARGMAVHARVAMYKVGGRHGVFDSDVLAGMDRAILDGVDVLSLSLGSDPMPFHSDTVAIGAFSAIKKGIFVSCSAGNSGPAEASVTNLAPWIMTVGASSIDRDFPAYVQLGNGKNVTGTSLYMGNGMGKSLVSLYYSEGGNSNSSGHLCLPATLDTSQVKGKVVLCDRGNNTRVEKGYVVKQAGGVGMIMANTAANGEELIADSHLLPAVAVGKKDGDVIREYVRTNKNPTAVLSFGGTVVNVKPAPVVAAFSSRGPNTVTQQILKPDLIAPGVNILAAWPEAIGPTGLEKDTRKTPFNIMSGTSMSCPHISGLAALLKAAHPEWSPSAIKSALMTTAYTKDNTNSSLRDAANASFSNPYAHGAGHVDPRKAMSPGLVYDAKPDDYIAFLCSLSYSIEQIKSIVKRPNITCSRRFKDPGQLNYPSFSVLFSRSRVARYTRELTNVGNAGSVYEVAVEAPPEVTVTVKPSKLVFSGVLTKQQYTVKFVSKKGVSPNAKEAFGSITWISADHQVRSPVAFSWMQLGGFH